MNGSRTLAKLKFDLHVDSNTYRGTHFVISLGATVLEKVISFTHFWDCALVIEMFIKFIE